MRKPLIAGNWKMHGSIEMIEQLSTALAEGWEGNGAVEMALFPPALYIKMVSDKVVSGGIEVGAQNICDQQVGAYTGETSAAMLADMKCHYTLVGHSERRALYGESNEVVADKFAAALEAKITPVLCVGETLQQREEGATEQVVAGQIQAVIDRVGLQAVCDAVVAYEPVWAIGTGKTASPQQAQSVHAAIRAQLGDAGAQTRLLYGGSVKAANAKELFDQADIDGGLVGGASLDAEEFLNIAKAAQ